MNTNTIRSALNWPAGKAVNTALPAAESWLAATRWHRALHCGLRLLLAVLPALALVVGAAWAVSAFTSPYLLQAMVWAGGFIFLAMAMESRKPNATALLATGLALPVLAMLSNWLATEFVVIAVALAAVWVAAAILRH